MRTLQCCIKNWHAILAIIKRCHVFLVKSDTYCNHFIGPIPWGHSGPLCHLLSLLLLSWTLHATCAIAIAGVRLATPGDWQCNGGSQNLANGPNIFQMLLVIHVIVIMAEKLVITLYSVTLDFIVFLLYIIKSNGVCEECVYLRNECQFTTTVERNS